MFLQGSIHRFDLASILQFLAQNACTGILEVRDFDEYGFIYLVEGRVEGISLPITDEKLGSRLVKAGLLTEQKLSEILIEESSLTKEEKKAAPLGQRLLDKGYITEDQVRDIMAKQTLDQVFALAHWQNGVFEYTEPEKMPEFKVRIQANIQEILLDAYRRIDEGEELTIAKTMIENEVCFRCPVEEECNDEIKAKYLKPDACLWRRMGAVIDDDYERVQDAQRLYKSRESGRQARTRDGAGLGRYVWTSKHELAATGDRVGRSAETREARTDNGGTMSDDVLETILRDVLDVIPDGVFVTNTDREIIYWNEAAARIAGYAAEDVIGARCCDLLADRDAAAAAL